MLHSSLVPADLHVEPEIEAQFEALLDIVRRQLPGADEEMLRSAFRVAYYAHRDMTRASGEPYITHPLEVAKIYAEEMAVDDVSVAAALLHDVIEDTDVTLDLLREMFGDDLAELVDGLTKIRSVSPKREEGQAENVRKLMLSMASDVRVILVKFADRLHNIRTLGALKEDKARRIASETLDLFAPLAHRFGLARIKNELEARSLEVLDPEGYRTIVHALEDTMEERAAYLKTFTEPIDEVLREDGLHFSLSARSKSVYSIYRKTKRQDKTVDELDDILAVRIVLDDPAVPRPDGMTDEDYAKAVAAAEARVCWHAYSLVASLYQPVVERLHDYISTPKSNGYQSLHTTVIGPGGKRVEVQVRTQRMHDVADRGVAAHWKYKEGTSAKGQSARLDDYLSWVRDLLETSPDEQATEFVRDFRLTLYDTEIYVFTPKGKLVTLPAGATPVDFAFQVHTEVGYHCIGAKVNGRIVPLSHRLHSGDQVEIITSKKQTPNPDWVKFVVTQKAQSRIRHFVNEKRRKAIELGREMWDKRAKKAGMETIDDTAFQRVARRLKFSSLQDMFYEIGVGLHEPDDLIALLRAPRSLDDDRTERRPAVVTPSRTPGQDGPSLIVDGEHSGDIHTEYASCCSPIPEEEIFGFVSRSGVIKIHRVNCRNAADLLHRHADRVVNVEWSRHKDAMFVTALRVTGEDRVGIVSDLTTVISKNLKTNIRSLSVDTEEGIFEGTIALYVSNLDHLQRVMQRLRRVEGVHGVFRRDRFEGVDAEE